MKIYVPNESENKKVISFLNKVFHKPFPRLIPSLYGKGKNTMKYHFAANKDGVLRGAVCAYPEAIIINGIAINGIAIGMVATDKKTRGQGIMSAMLNHSFKEYQDSYEISMLTGRRHRYEHFGYYPAGANYLYDISDMSIKKWDKGNPYTIVKAKTEEDFEAVNKLSQGCPLRVERPLANESDVLRNWFSNLYLVKKDGITVGYASGKFFVHHELECMYIDKGESIDYIQAVKAYKDMKRIKLLKVQVLPSEKVFKEAMSLCSEECTMVAHDKYKVFSYKKLLEKLVAISLVDLADLNYNGVVEIVGREKLKINVGNGAYAIEETTEAPTLIISEKDMIAQLFGLDECFIKGLHKVSLRHSDFI